MIEYGITTSKAHVWVHVCPLDARLYWYQRRVMLPLLPKFPTREIPTARGHLARLIGNRVCDGGVIREVERDDVWFRQWAWKQAETDGDAGAMAEAMFAQVVAEHGFPFPLTAERYEERADQYQGKDFRLTPKLAAIDVEVKADFVGGEWGTGNLFIQTHELRHQHGARHAHWEARHV